MEACVCKSCRCTKPSTLFYGAWPLVDNNTELGTAKAMPGQSKVLAGWDRPWVAVAGPSRGGKLRWAARGVKAVDRLCPDCG